MAKKIQLEENDLPLGTDLTQEAAPATAPKPSDEGRQDKKNEYAPSQATLDRLGKLPKDDIRKELGLNIDELIKTTKKRGVLEALAYGDFTRPVDLELRTEHGARIKTKATVRIYAFENGDWRPEVHPILPLVEKVNPDGKKVMTYNRNPITEEDVKNQTISFNGKRLSSEQIDRLRLTGHLGDPIIGTNMRGESVTTIVSVDPYNHHELCTVSENSIRNRISAQDGYVYTDDNNQRRTIPLDDKMKGELALGHGVWGKDDLGNNKYLQYNAATSRIELSVEYSYAVKMERSKKEAKNVTQTQSATVKNNQAKGVGASL